MNGGWRMWTVLSCCCHSPGHTKYSRDEVKTFVSIIGPHLYADGGHGTKLGWEKMRTKPGNLTFPHLQNTFIYLLNFRKLLNEQIVSEEIKGLFSFKCFHFPIDGTEKKILKISNYCKIFQTVFLNCTYRLLNIVPAFRL